MTRMRKRLLKITIGLLSPLLIFILLNLAYPLDLSRYETLSVEILDADDQPLRIYLTGDDMLRLPVTADEVDENYLKMLIAYEDKRFYSHMGIDPLAMGRAAWQAMNARHIVSGASTLTMQVAKLLEPRPRTLATKIIEIFRAIQLEQYFTKDEILSIYLTLAPYGGNREGIRAAMLTYFNRSPSQMTAGEAALFVALPQSPSRNRPDHYPERARAARDKILTRVRKSGAFAPDVIDLALTEYIDAQYTPLPALAPHLSDRLKESKNHSTWIDADMQDWAERSIQQYVKALPAGTSAAMLVVENDSRHVIGYVGSANYHDALSDGYVDMVRAVRSPGSTLKPFIYGMVMERGLAHPDSRINDVPTAFGNYQPKNFRDEHYGDITLKTALQKSLNVPAVLAMERLGPVRFVEAMRRQGMKLILPDEAKPGLAVALGGVGTRLESLVKTYAAMGHDGRIRELQYSRGGGKFSAKKPFLGKKTLWQMADILRGVLPPTGLMDEKFNARDRDISYKTGTSYGFRDAWAIGYNRDYTVGVWIGRPDGVPNPGHFGASSAAPLLFKIFDRLPDAPGAHLNRPDNIFEVRLPPSRLRFDRLVSRTKWLQNTAPPQITFPISGSLIELPRDGRELILEAEGGKRPFTWVINGYPQKSSRWSKTVQWQPDGPGFSEITLIDALGRRVSSNIQLQ